MKVATLLAAHENSEVYRDTLESVRRYLSEDVLVLIDGFAWNQFRDEKVEKVEGFRHGKPSNPARNMALGLMSAWERWGDSVNWYCYIEYDCLVGSSEVLNHLRMADERGFWLLGNDLRRIEGTMPELERLCGSSGIRLHSFLGCCLFFSARFMLELSKRKFFSRLLEYTNFFPAEFNLFSSNPTGAYLGRHNSGKNSGKKKNLPVYDSSEFIYPSLAVHYGGSVEEMAHWDQVNESWGGNYLFYPMRFRPELSPNDPFQRACVMHPLKTAENPIRAYHRSLRMIS